MRKSTLVLIGFALLAFSPVASAAVVLPAGSTWEYTFTDPGGLGWTTGSGGWSTGSAPFGNYISAGVGDSYDPNGYFNYNTLWPAAPADPVERDDDLWVRTTFNSNGFYLSSIGWNLGVDNGFTLYLNGTQIFAANGEGYTSRWEYSGSFAPHVLPGLNYLAVALEDHGGLTAFDMEVVGQPVPEPGTLLLLGSGISALALRRRRKS
jgi:hypothetical protein